MAITSLSTVFTGLSVSSSSGLSFLGGECRVSTAGEASVSSQGPAGVVIEAAHKKGSGSTKNGRDSKPKMLGVKIYGDQTAQPGAIIVRQRGTKFHPGKNVGIGRDYTIYSLIDGLVKFEKFGPDRKKISVYPVTEEKVENPNSRKVRRREFFRERRERRRAYQEGTEVFDPSLAMASAESAEGSDEKALC
ncbi:hypothetical protein KC19_11G045900 [Ceratodon purpureus]|uniref:Large ribosomal subunit protein bL27c n=1 Tax=Ceratodon purpureus TaxID=3225 RepID=A0A8T0GBA1_CERPU|nr:hypothetical protein KC19_11G045900 [Ceratodon purpureus]